MGLKIKLRFFALYREVVGQEQMEVVAREGTTPSQVWDGLCQDFPRLVEQSNAWKVAINGEYADLDGSLQEGDEVAFIPPLSGG